MMWDEWEDEIHEDREESEQQQQQDSHLNFDFLSVLSKPKVYL